MAGATTTLRLGTAISLITERDPIVTAKAVASLDRLSGGRFELGVGAGWNEEEMRNHGTDPKRRFALMRERVLAMREIWTKDEAEFHGEYVDFDPIFSLAQARAGPASADPDGRQRPEGGGARARVRGRVDAQHARPGHARASGSPTCAGAARRRAAGASA